MEVPLRLPRRVSHADDLAAGRAATTVTNSSTAWSLRWREAPTSTTRSRAPRGVARQPDDGKLPVLHVRSAVLDRLGTHGAATRIARSSEARPTTRCTMIEPRPRLPRASAATRGEEMPWTRCAQAAYPEDAHLAMYLHRSRGPVRPPRTQIDAADADRMPLLPAGTGTSSGSSLHERPTRKSEPSTTKGGDHEKAL